MSSSNELGWSDTVWQEINEAVVAEVTKTRTAQKVFPTHTFDTNPTEIPSESIDFQNLSIREGQTKPFVEIYHEFSLTGTQVAREAELKTCTTLARMAAKAIALAEDAVIFQGQWANPPAQIKADLTLAEDGLLGVADPKDANGKSMNLGDDKDPTKVSVPIPVPLSTSAKGGAKSKAVWGENTFSAVADGIAKLTAKAQAPDFALFLPVRAYADTFVPPSDASLVTTSERIKPLVEGGFVECVSLPPNQGLLVALAGDPTSLHLGQEATTEFLRKDGSKHHFRVVERIQFVVRDPRAFVLLDFQ